MRLQGPAGVVARGLTNELGLLNLRAPAPGTYRLKIDRIGWVGTTTDPVTLEAGQSLRLVISMPSRRNLLPTLEVRAKSRCDGKAQGGELATVLWDEIRKALFANMITQSQESIPLHLKEFVREVTLAGQPVREWVVVSRIIRGRPFASLPPASLVKEGFVRVVDDSTEFAGPDAALLLSDEFVATHCFQAVSGAAGLVGLGFTPTPRRGVPEILGTMWVDRETSELRYLEYAYTPLPGVLEHAKLGGRVEFHQLPGGAWVVGSWFIRMPRLVTTTQYVKESWREITELEGYFERGGHAVVALDAMGRVDRAILRGQVFDSVEGTGLAHALVWVQGLPDSMYTDIEGRYEMAVEASGDHTVSVRHAKLGLLNDSTARVALLSLNDTATVNFAVPSMGAFVRTLCRNQNPPGTVSIVGLAWKTDGAPASDWQVRAMRRTGRGNVPIGGTSMRPNPKGLYGLCRIPGRDTVQLILSFGKLTKAEIPVALAGASRWISFREWGSPDTTVRTVRGDTASAPSAQPHPPGEIRP